MTLKSHDKLDSVWTYLDKTSIAYATCQKFK
jgi:hypothetical protein